MTCLPIFTSTYSNSILKLSAYSPKDKRQKGTADSVIDIVTDYNETTKTPIQQVYLFENSFAGLREAYQNIDNLVFGMKFKFGAEKAQHKCYIVPENEEALKKLFALNNEIYITKGYFDYEDLDGLECSALLTYPFYSSWIAKNALYVRSECLPPKTGLKQVYMVEDNNLPQDVIVEDKLKAYTSHYGLETIKTKTILYKERKDFVAWQVYHLSTNKKHSGKPQTLMEPNLDFCSSAEFSFEAWVETQK